MSKKKPSKTTSDWVKEIESEIQKGSTLEQVIAGNLEIPVDAIREYAKKIAAEMATKKKTSTGGLVASHGCSSSPINIGRRKKP